MKYLKAIETVKQILDANDVQQEEDGTYYFMLNNEIGYHTVTEEVAHDVIDETLESRSIDWYDDNHMEGDVEICGKKITIYFADGEQE